MKTAGWIFIVFAVLNLIAFIAAIGIGTSEMAGSKIGAAIMLGVLGGFLLHRGKQKEQEEKDRKKWNEDSADGKTNK